MARRRTSSTIALPWERRGSRIRELIVGVRWRWLAAALVAIAVALAIGASARERARVRRTHAVIAEVHRAIARFRADFGRCPRTMRELVHPARSGVHYLDEEPVDGWGNRLWVRCPGRYDPDGVDVVSAGPSGNFLEDDNIQ